MTLTITVDSVDITDKVRLEKLNFEIFHAFEAEEIQFSMPFRHTFWKHDAEKGPLDVRLLSDDAQPDEDRG